MRCPYCASKIRVNTKYYGRGNDHSLTKQAQCTSRTCDAKGPLTKTLLEAKALFGVPE